MAQRRMFSLKVVDTDIFLDMPQSAQLLYFHLAMRADDDGFVNSPKKIMAFSGSKQDDFKILVAKDFIIPFQSGVIVIKHWKENNYIPKDRYKETIYKKEKGQIVIDDNGMYTKCIQDVYSLETQDRIGKDRIGKDRIGKDIYSARTNEIIADLNIVLGTKYGKGRKTKDLIKARINEGFKIDDFKEVHRKMNMIWGPDEKMSKYLRPETLYSNKFESYLNMKMPDHSISDAGKHAYMVGQQWIKNREARENAKKS